MPYALLVKGIVAVLNAHLSFSLSPLSLSLSLSLPKTKHQPLLQQGDGALAGGPPERRQDVARGRARDGGVPGGALNVSFVSREHLSAGEPGKKKNSKT